MNLVLLLLEGCEDGEGIGFGVGGAGVVPGEGGTGLFGERVDAGSQGFEDDTACV